jgi:hypothetical protein
MSLLSQKDRNLTIEALQYLAENIDKKMFNNPPQREELQNKKTQVLTLLNWIKLEYQKNED